MEIRQLEYFMAVATEMNFSRAAQQIHVVQSALSVAVSKLEKELGVELFDRSRQKIRITPAGETFREHARRVIQTAQLAKNSISDYRGEPTGTIEFGSLISFGELDLPKILGGVSPQPSTGPNQTAAKQAQTGLSSHLSAIADGALDLAWYPNLTTAHPHHDALSCARTNPVRLPTRSSSGPTRSTRHQRTRRGRPHQLAHRVRPSPTDRQHVRQAGITPRILYELADFSLAARLVQHSLEAPSCPPAKPATTPVCARCHYDKTDLVIHLAWSATPKDRQHQTRPTNSGIGSPVAVNFQCRTGSNAIPAQNLSRIIGARPGVPLRS